MACGQDADIKFCSSGVRFLINISPTLRIKSLLSHSTGVDRKAEQEKVGENLWADSDQMSPLFRNTGPIVPPQQFQLAQFHKAANLPLRFALAPAPESH
jgi:hypothetical protein